MSSTSLVSSWDVTSGVRDPVLSISLLAAAIFFFKSQLTRENLEALLERK